MKASWSRVASFACSVALACMLAGCRETAKDEPGELVVLAAASLKRAFETMEGDFERAHPGVDVRFAFAGSQELRRQLEAGARADVFASADELHMQAVAEQNLVDRPVVFTKNEPVVVVFARSRVPIVEFGELPLAARIVLGAPEVPIGRYSLQILERAEAKIGATFRRRVEERVASRELSVRQVLAKVSLGEADAGIVYRSDVLPVPRDVRVVSIPAEVNVVARYPIAAVRSSSRPTLAHAWIEFVRSALGTAALRSAGFQPMVAD